MQLFQAFSQAGEAQPPDALRRHGLGLAISQRLVQMMQGKIELTGDGSDGSEFFFGLTATGKVTASP